MKPVALPTGGKGEEHFGCIRRLKVTPLARKVKLAGPAQSAGQPPCASRERPPEKLRLWQEKYRRAWKR